LLREMVDRGILVEREGRYALAERAANGSGLYLRRMHSLDIRCGFYAEKAVAMALEEAGEPVLESHAGKRDGEIDLVTPNFVVEVRNKLDEVQRHEVEEFLAKARRYPSKKPLLVARALSPSAKVLARLRGACWVETGLKLLMPNAAYLAYMERIRAMRLCTTDAAGWRRRVASAVKWRRYKLLRRN